jgi:hypothetical protein
MTSVVELLMAAQQDKAIVTVVYNGGSKPGEPRQIIPVRIQGNSVFARVPGLAQEKTFKLEKIERVTLENGQSAENLSVKPVERYAVPAFDTLEQYASFLKSSYEERGWYVFHDTTERMFGVGRFLKNGSPRKHPVISVQFMDRTKEATLDLDTGEMVFREKQLTGRERPWRVDSELQLQGKSFAKLQEAFAYFANDVDTADPTAPRGK